jgi:hypothetical protein
VHSSRGFPTGREVKVPTKKVYKQSSLSVKQVMVSLYLRRFLERAYGKGRWRKGKGKATVRLPDGTVCDAEITGSKRTGLAARISKLSDNLMSEFVICINNDSNPASLVLGKVYRTLPDAEAKARNMLRVIDEDKSEPDGYLYPASMFAAIELPEVAKRALTAAGA